jgi:hypothetical protein
VLLLAKKLISLRVTTKLLEQAERDPAVGARVGLAVHRMMHLTDAKNPNPETEPASLEMCETGFERLNALCVLTSTRTIGDYEALPLPRPLCCLYYLTRPFRLASKFLSVR